MEAGANKGMLSAVNWLIIKVACFELQKAVVKGRQVCIAYIVEPSSVAPHPPVGPTVGIYTTLLQPFIKATAIIFLPVFLSQLKTPSA